jgi:hypothetical protein
VVFYYNQIKKNYGVYFDYPPLPKRIEIYKNKIKSQIPPINMEDVQ